ncbi:MAG: response regulator [Magnetococcales bacterium]|nr:response regulator [Magnetococcales bacterium]
MLRDQKQLEIINAIQSDYIGMHPFRTVLAKGLMAMMRMTHSSHGLLIGFEPNDGHDDAPWVSVTLVEGADLAKDGAGTDGNGPLWSWVRQVIERGAVNTSDKWPREVSTWLQSDGRGVSLMALPLVDGQKLLGGTILFGRLLGDEQTRTTSLQPLADTLAAIINREQHQRNQNKILDDAKQASRAKSHFLAHISHEIRTPMNVILGMGQLLSKTDLTPRQKDLLSKSQDASQSLLNIINNVLDFSKIEAGQLELESVPFALSGVMKRVLGLISLQSIRKGLEILFDVAADVPSTLVGDPLRLEQVLTNLGSNAVKFTQQGLIIFRVGVREQTATKVTLGFQVQDTGIGMDREQSAKLFQPFHQGLASTTRQYGGTGLGLAISQHLVQLMGGKIEVDSVPGEGSRFHFVLTLMYRQEQAPRFKETALPLHGLKVLIVDDCEDVLKIMAGMLTTFSFSVITAASGGEALKMLDGMEARGEECDLVIVDWRMSGMDGMETATRIKAKRGSREKPRIILMTSFGWNELTNNGHEGIFQGFLRKPTTYSTLLDTILESFSGRVAQPYEPLELRRVPASVLQRIQGMRIMVAEDHKINWEIVENFLESAGVAASWARNGQEAVHMVVHGQEQYDAILMDLQMPVLDGYEASRRILEHFRNTPRPAIIAMTAHAVVAERQKCFDVGMIDFISKPVDAGELYLVLSKIDRPLLSSREPLSTKATAQNKTWRSGQGLGDLPGIDLADGLGRMDGRIDLLSRLIRDFAHQNASFFDELTHLLKAGALQEAKKKVHDLKGLAGGISARKLWLLAMDLEEILAEETAERDELLKRVQEAMSEVTDSARRLEEEARSASGSETMPLLVTVSRSELSALLSGLKHLVDRGDFQATAMFRELKPILVAQGYGGMASGMETCLDSFDFVRFKELLAKMMQELEEKDALMA